MKSLALGALAFTLVAGAPGGTDAQAHIVVEPPATPPTARPARLPVARPATLPAQTPPPLSPAEEVERAELAWVVFRSRNIFIGSTVATALGAALVFPAEANQCADEPKSLDRCTPGGKAMVVIGYPLLLVGGISMLSSGIVFGVMKGKLRRLEQRAA
ncbi:MAG: hypothetical protein OES21_02240, partial [Myxococcales bacterium]|nr:hypothetical protein [Myxococcales bacterium]